MKRMIKLLLCMAMLLGVILCVTVCAHASWDSSAAYSFFTGTGTQSNPYVVSSEEHLAYFANQLKGGNTFAGKYISLECDLDMTGKEWSVGTTEFAGTFLGNGNTITINNRFLYKVTADGVIDWLDLRNTEAMTDPLMCEYNYGVIQNCRVEGVIYDDDTSSACLLCYYNYGTVVNSSGFGSVKGYGDDCSVWVGWISHSTGSIKNCYTVLELGGSAPGKYNDLYMHGIVASGSYDNCYTGDSVLANDADFVAVLNQSMVVPGYIWVQDKNGTNGGYPIITNCLAATVTLAYSTEPMFTFHSDSISTKINCDVSGCTVYYTLDGSDPTKSSTRKTYTGSLTLNTDSVITMVAYKNGDYSTPNRQYAVKMLGSGTTSNPYIVSTKTQLCAIYLEPDKVYELAADFDFSAGGYVHNGLEVANWEPIGSFSGTLDGNGHSITELSSSKGGFINSNSGTIKDLRLIDHHLYKDTTGDFGPLAKSNYGLITRCYAAADPNVKSYTKIIFNSVGGLVGENTGVISYCSTSGDIRADATENYSLYYMGGIAGRNIGEIRSCYSDARIYGPQTNHDLGSSTGGISSGGDVFDCRFDGYCWNGGYDAWIGIVAYDSPGSPSVNAERTYDGGAVFEHNTGSKRHRYYGDDAYTATGTGADLMELSFPAFDFNTVWMITDDGPMPQGVMQADGKWYTKYSYSAPGMTTGGKTVCYTNGGYPLLTITLPASGVEIGTHGDNLIWKLTADGALTITGKGAMAGDDPFDFPWYDYGGEVIASQITSIEIGSGVTTIAPYAFYKSGATTISLPNTLTTIGNEAFDRSNIAEMTLPASLTELGYKVFYGKNITLTFSGSAPNFNDNTFDGATVTAYYPANNTTWTSDVRQNYGGDVTWICNGTCTHNSGYRTTVGKVDATCTDSGYTGDSVCRLCDKTASVGKATDALGHKEVRQLGLEPTCTEDGYIKVTCGRCDYTDSETLAALGHRIRMGEGGIVDPLTVENNSAVPFIRNENTYTSANKSNSSSSEIRINALYDFALTLTYSVSSEATHDKLTILHNGTQKAAISGIISDAVMELKLTAGDVVTVRYSKDGSISRNKDQGWVTLQYEQINLDIPAETIEPTCSNDVVCDFCQTVVKNALPHTAVIDEAKAPTCTETGLTEGSHCDVCGEPIVPQETVPENGHSYTEDKFVWSAELSCATVTLVCHCGDTQEHSANIAWDKSQSGKLTVTASVTVGEQEFTASKEIGVVKAGNNVIITLPEEIPDIEIYVAVYDDEGRMISIQKGQVDKNSAFVEISGGNSRVFIVTDGFAPICPSLEF